MMNVMRRMYLWWSDLWRKKYDGLEEIEFDKIFEGDIIIMSYNGEKYELEVLNDLYGDVDIKLARYRDKAKHERTLLYRYPSHSLKIKYYKRAASQLKTNLMNL